MIDETKGLNLVCIKCSKPYSPGVCERCRVDMKAYKAKLKELNSARSLNRYNAYRKKERVNES